MKIIFLTLLSSLFLLSCSSYESRTEIIDQALSFQSKDNESVIYIIRDFNTENPTKIEFNLRQIRDVGSQNKRLDAMHALDEDYMQGAGLAYDFYFMDKPSYVRMEMPPGDYAMYAFFFMASGSEIIPSRKITEFEPGKVYIYKIVPRPEGAYSATIYFLEDITVDEARKIIKENNLPLIEFDPEYQGMAM